MTNHFRVNAGGLQVSVGGAIANNIHGKDCFKNGYFKTIYFSKIN